VAGGFFMIQREFQMIVAEVIKRCDNYFQNRLSAIYITGSIHTNEAIIGESDLDGWIFIADDLSSRDKAWIKVTEMDIDSTYEIIDGVHINVKTVQELHDDKFIRFALKYNSTLCFGVDIIAKIESSGADTYEPNKSMAQGRLLFARQCLEDAMINICPECMEKIPKNTYFAARKFARYFILLEGAYYLMAKGEFETYKQDRVVQQLKEHTVGFCDTLDRSLAVLKDPLTAAVKHDDYIAQIYPFVVWMFDEIKKA